MAVAVLVLVAGGVWWAMRGGGDAGGPPVAATTAPPAPRATSVATPRRTPPPRARVEVAPPPEPVEAPTPEPAAAPTLLDWTGDVRDTAGAAVADAAVTLLDDQDECVDAARTDAAGAFVVPGHGMTAGSVVVRHAGFETARVAVSRATKDAPPDRVAVVLGPGAAIEGDVVLPDGNAPSKQIRVAADPADGPPLSERDAARATRGHPLVATAVTDVAGRFRIDGLRPGRRYRLHAGGPGYLRVWGNPSAPPSAAGGERARVVVAPVYVLNLRVRGPDGGPLRSAPQLMDRGGTGWSGSAGELEMSGATGAAVCWSEVPGAKEALADWRGRTFVLYLAARETDRIGPLHLSAGASGYARKQMDVWAVRSTSASSEPQEIRLDEIATAWGRLRIRLDDAGTGIARAFDGIDAPAARISRCVTITPVAQTEPRIGSYRLPLERWPTDVIGLDAVPAGKWRVHLDLPFAAPEVSRTWVEVDVTEAEPADVVLSVSTWSAIEIAPTTGGDARTPYAGPLSVTVFRSGTDQASMTSFAGPPYRMAGMEPRAYDVVVGCASGSARVDRVDAAAQTVTPLDVRLAPLPPR